MNDDVSISLAALVALIEQYQQKPLRRPDAFTALLRRAWKKRSFDALADTAFRGNAVSRLLRTLRGQPPESQHNEILEQEFSRVVQEFHDAMMTLMSGEEFEDAPILDAYVAVSSPEALRGLIELAEDFGALKEWERAMNEQDPSA
jgi:hypothetical protein